MRQPWLLLGLALVMVRPAHPQAPKGEKPAARAIGVYLPNGWHLALDADGSGRVSYGASFADSWGFKRGTFDVAQVTKDLKTLASDRDGRQGSHFVFTFESERKGPGEPGPARYTRDTRVIPALFARAIEAAQVKKSARGAFLLEKHPAALPKDR